MWRLTMIFLMLIAAITGTPLRQAEAAADFARSVSGFGHDDDVEEVDGGVGDDVELSLSPTQEQSLAPPVMLPLASLVFVATPPRPRLIFRNLEDGRGEAVLPNSSQRHAWLQHFRF